MVRRAASRTNAKPSPSSRSRLSPLRARYRSERLRLPNCWSDSRRRPGSNAAISGTRRRHQFSRLQKGTGGMFSGGMASSAGTGGTISGLSTTLLMYLRDVVRKIRQPWRVAAQRPTVYSRHQNPPPIYPFMRRGAIVKFLAFCLMVIFALAGLMLMIAAIHNHFAISPHGWHCLRGRRRRVGDDEDDARHPYPRPPTWKSTSRAAVTWLENLQCKQCGAELDRESVSMAAARPVMVAPRPCSAEYQLEESAKW